MNCCANCKYWVRLQYKNEPCFFGDCGMQWAVVDHFKRKEVRYTRTFEDDCCPGYKLSEDTDRASEDIVCPICGVKIQQVARY